MQSNSTTMQIAQFAQKPPAPKPDATHRLQHARQRLRFALRSVIVNEGRLLDFETAEEIGRALVAASRDLEELTLQVAVMARKGA